MRQQCWRPLSPMAATPPSMWSSPHAGPASCSTCGSSWVHCAAAVPIPNSHSAHGSKDEWFPSATWASVCDLFSDPTVSQGAAEKGPLSYQEMGESRNLSTEEEILLQAFLMLQKYSWTPKSIKMRLEQSICLLLRRPSCRRYCQKDYKGEQDTCPFFR